MEQGVRTVELDVRPQLRNKQEPFQLIMDTVNTLTKEDTFVLHATFKPTPLLGLMTSKGYQHTVNQLESDHWTVTFIHESQQVKRIYELGNRGLEPPQPMIRTLSQLELASLGDTVIIHNDRVPLFLIEELNALGYEYSVAEQSDGTAKVEIHKN